MLWNDKRTPQGVFTESHTGQTHAWGAPPAPGAPGSWGVPSNLPPRDNSRMLSRINDEQRAQGKARDVAHATQGAAQHWSDWSKHGPDVRSHLR